MKLFTFSILTLLVSAQILTAQPCWTSVDMSEFHTAALGTNGTIWSWGGNNVGQLGNGANFPVYTPIQTGTDSDWREIS
ncbi:MAG: RCC1 domain-containing protein, partial [Bacteroidia bacterium]